MGLWDSRGGWSPNGGVAGGFTSSPREKHLLERAARATHQNLSAFVMQAAALRAEEVLAERSVIHLSFAAAEAFEEALERPGVVNERLTLSLDRPRGFRWVE